MKRSVNLSGTRQALMAYERRLALESMPEWYRRAIEQVSRLRIVAQRMMHPDLTDSERESIQATFDLANTLSASIGRKFSSGADVVETLYKLIDAGYIIRTGMYVHKPDNKDDRHNLHRSEIAATFDAMIWRSE